MSYGGPDRHDLAPFLPFLLLVAGLFWAVQHDDRPAEPPSRSTVATVASAEGDRYYANRNAYDGHHEVHRETCHPRNSPAPGNRIDLGRHPDCRSAVAAATRLLGNADGCYHCNRSCHTK